MNCQKHLFQLPDGIHYLNCAYMSPLLKSVEKRGIEGMRLKRNPLSIKPVDFFSGVVSVRQKFAQMVQCDPVQVAVMPSVHWMNATKFDLESIGARCREVGAKLIVDGSQSVGALPIDVKRANIDALICAAYKWLMGPYSTALSYIHEDFNEGIPLEESWMTRPDAERFDRLTHYVEGYKPGAVRFDVGQSSNFIFLPMLDEALRQLMEWGVEEIQEYSRLLGAPLIDYFLEKGIPVDDESHRAHHLMGLQLPASTNGEALVNELQSRNVFVSLRGSNIRISIL